MIAYPTNSFKKVWVLAMSNKARTQACLLRVCPNRNAATKALADYVRNYESVELSELARTKLDGGKLKFELGEKIFYVFRKE